MLYFLHEVMLLADQNAVDTNTEDGLDMSVTSQPDTDAEAS